MKVKLSTITDVKELNLGRNWKVIPEKTSVSEKGSETEKSVRKRDKRWKKSVPLFSLSPSFLGILYGEENL